MKEKSIESIENERNNFYKNLNGNIIEYSNKILRKSIIKIENVQNKMNKTINNLSNLIIKMQKKNIEI